MEIALYYFVVAYLACWEVDLIIIVARGPVMIDPILKFIIVLVCLVLVLMGGRTHHWWWGAGP